MGVGKIYTLSSQSVILRVASKKDLQVIFNHFDKYSLITKKLADYNLFKLAYSIIINQEHLTQRGLSKLVAIKGSLNLGLSPELKSAFPSITSMDKPIVTEQAQKKTGSKLISWIRDWRGLFFCCGSKASNF